MAAAIYMSIAASTNTGAAQGAQQLPAEEHKWRRKGAAPSPSHPGPPIPFQPPAVPATPCTARGQGSAFLVTPSNQSRDTRVHIFLGGRGAVEGWQVGPSVEGLWPAVVR